MANNSEFYASPPPPPTPQKNRQQQHFSSGGHSDSLNNHQQQQQQHVSTPRSLFGWAGAGGSSGDGLSPLVQSERTTLTTSSGTGSSSAHQHYSVGSNFSHLSSGSNSSGPGSGSTRRNTFASPQDGSASSFPRVGPTHFNPALLQQQSSSHDHQQQQQQEPLSNTSSNRQQFFDPTKSFLGSRTNTNMTAGSFGPGTADTSPVATTGVDTSSSAVTEILDQEGDNNNVGRMLLDDDDDDDDDFMRGRHLVMATDNDQQQQQHQRNRKHGAGGGGADGKRRSGHHSRPSNSSTIHTTGGSSLTSPSRMGAVVNLFGSGDDNGNLFGNSNNNNNGNRPSGGGGVGPGGFAVRRGLFEDGEDDDDGGGNGGTTQNCGGGGGNSNNNGGGGNQQNNNDDFTDDDGYGDNDNSLVAVVPGDGYDDGGNDGGGDNNGSNNNMMMNSSSFLDNGSIQQGLGDGGVPSRMRQEFVELGEVGKGDFGAVIAALSQGDGVDYAIKISHTLAESEKLRQNRLQEVYALSSCPSSQFLLRYYDSWEEESRLHIQTELFPLGNIMRNFSGGMEESELWQLALQLSIGLYTMHLGNAAHIDIKPENIFQKMVEEFQADSSSSRMRRIYVLGDFGLARPLSAASYHGAGGGGGSVKDPSTGFNSPSGTQPGNNNNNNNNMHDSSSVIKGSMASIGTDFPPSMPQLPSGHNNDDDDFGDDDEGTRMWGGSMKVVPPPNLITRGANNGSSTTNNEDGAINPHDRNFHNTSSGTAAATAAAHGRTSSMQNNNNNNNHRHSTSFNVGVNDEEGDGRYVSPELLRAVLAEEDPDLDLRACDIFSFGVSLAHLSGCDPRSARHGDLSGMDDRHHRGKSNFYSREWRQFVGSMLMEEPSARPAALRLMLTASDHCPETHINTTTPTARAAAAARNNPNSEQQQQQQHHQDNDDDFPAVAFGSDAECCFIDDPAVLLRQLTDLKAQVRRELDMQSAGTTNSSLLHNSSVLSHN